MICCASPLRQFKALIMDHGVNDRKAVVACVDVINE
jgi:hypothetical protein